MPSPTTLQGRIYDAQENPLANVIVHALDQDLRTATLLGKSEPTDAKGFYKIVLSQERATLAELKTADVFIQVFDRAGRLLGQSEPVFNPPADLTIDFKIGGGAIKGISEFDAMVALINPLILPQLVPLGELKEDAQHKDFSFLSRETGLDGGRIEMLNTAHHRHRDGFVSAAAFYGLFRLGYPQKLEDLCLIQRQSIIEGLKQAIAENIISSKETPFVEKYAAMLDATATAVILAGKTKETAQFKKFIGLAIDDAHLQKVFTDQLLATETEPEKFFEKLDLHREFRDGKAIAAVKSVLELAELTAFEPALTGLLFKKRSQGTQQALSMGAFAAQFQLGDWKQFIQKLHADGQIVDFPEGITGDTPAAKIDNYAQAMDTLVGRLFPTQVFAHRIGTDDATIFGGQRMEIQKLLAINPKFDLREKVEKQLATANLTGITLTPVLLGELKKIYRLYKLSPEPKHVIALDKLELYSASAIVNLGLLGLTLALANRTTTAEDAENIFNNAISVHNQTISGIDEP